MESNDMEDEKPTEPDDDALDQVADAWASVLIDVHNKLKEQANAKTDDDSADFDTEKDGDDDQS